jgi:SAM-dependent methyltransferase
MCRAVAALLWPNPRFALCGTCGLRFRDPLPHPDELNALYRQSWKNPDRKTGETGTTDFALAEHYLKHLLTTLGRSDMAGQTILDFGAGRGNMTRALMRSGADVYPLEPFGFDRLSREKIHAFRELDDIPGELRFDGIVACEVIEHLRSPWDDFGTIARHLKPDGWVFLTTPNARGLKARLQHARWNEAARDGHLFLFDEGSLKFLLARSGLRDGRRLHCFVRYTNHPIKLALHWLLQTSSLDGGLRMLAWR